MNRILALILLSCPLAAAAAEWRYDGQPSPGGPDGGAMMVETKASAGSMTVTAGPAPADAPRGSMTMEEVRAAKGDPDSILEPVGDPPITRWQYPEFVVYFEHDRVITSVAGRW